MVFSKPYDVNEVSRIQIAKIAHRYKMQKKNTPEYQLKDKGLLDSIKRDWLSEIKKRQWFARFSAYQLKKIDLIDGDLIFDVV